MGNTIVRGKKAKIMKVDGETIKLKTPTKVRDVIKDHPGYVLLDSDTVKQFGLRAKPLESHQELKPKKIYFLVELPNFPEEKKIVDPEIKPRRVRSGIHMSAKDRLELLMLSKRSVSDVNFSGSYSGGVLDRIETASGPVRVKMRVPKAQMEKLVEESRDGVEVAEKIIGLYLGGSDEVSGGGDRMRQPWKAEEMNVKGKNVKTRQKRVSFVPEVEDHLTKLLG